MSRKYGIFGRYIYNLKCKYFGNSFCMHTWSIKNLICQYMHNFPLWQMLFDVYQLFDCSCLTDFGYELFCWHDQDRMYNSYFLLTSWSGLWCVKGSGLPSSRICSSCVICDILRYLRLIPILITNLSGLFPTQFVSLSD